MNINCQWYSCSQIDLLPLRKLCRPLGGWRGRQELDSRPDVRGRRVQGMAIEYLWEDTGRCARPLALWCLLLLRRKVNIWLHMPLPHLSVRQNLYCLCELRTKQSAPSCYSRQWMVFDSIFPRWPWLQRNTKEQNKLKKRKACPSWQPPYIRFFKINLKIN